mmetsp:Transcript_39516/g.80611  ORF Transcript_39516/g.80611 Transcript_39516/m.80611 type:complete len:276 (-) Transcript_39516:119-946(-)
MAQACLVQDRHQRRDDETLRELGRSRRSTAADAERRIQGGGGRPRRHRRVRSGEERDVGAPGPGHGSGVAVPALSAAAGGALVRLGGRSGVRGPGSVRRGEGPAEGRGREHGRVAVVVVIIVVVALVVRVGVQVHRESEAALGHGDEAPGILGTRRPADRTASREVVRTAAAVQRRALNVRHDASGFRGRRRLRGSVDLLLLRVAREERHGLRLGLDLHAILAGIERDLTAQAELRAVVVSASDSTSSSRGRGGRRRSSRSPGARRRGLQRRGED